MPVFPLNALEGAVTQDIVLPFGEDVYHITYGVLLSTGTVAGDLQGVVDDLRTAFATEMGAMCSVDYTVGGTKLIAKVGVTEYVRIKAGADVGLGGSDPVPPNCALYVRKLSGSAGHAGIGSCYFPGFVGVTEITALGYLQSGDLITKQNTVDDWLTAVQAVSHVDDMAILHRSTGNAATPVTNLIVEAKLATQHRRFNSK